MDIQIRKICDSKKIYWNIYSIHLLPTGVLIVSDKFSLHQYDFGGSHWRKYDGIHFSCVVPLKTKKDHFASCSYNTNAQRFEITTWNSVSNKCVQIHIRYRVPANQIFESKTGRLVILWKDGRTTFSPFNGESNKSIHIDGIERILCELKENVFVYQKQNGILYEFDANKKYRDKITNQVVSTSTPIRSSTKYVRSEHHKNTWFVKPSDSTRSTELMRYDAKTRQTIPSNDTPKADFIERFDDTRWFFGLSSKKGKPLALFWDENGTLISQRTFGETSPRDLFSIHKDWFVLANSSSKQFSLYRIKFVQVSLLNKCCSFIAQNMQDEEELNSIEPCLPKELFETVRFFYSRLLKK